MAVAEMARRGRPGEHSGHVLGTDGEAEHRARGGASRTRGRRGGLCAPAWASQGLTGRCSRLEILNCGTLPLSPENVPECGLRLDRDSKRAWTPRGACREEGGWKSRGSRPAPVLGGPAPRPPFRSRAACLFMPSSTRFSSSRAPTMTVRGWTRVTRGCAFGPRRPVPASPGRRSCPCGLHADTAARRQAGPPTPHLPQTLPRPWTSFWHGGRSHASKAVASLWVDGGGPSAEP